MSLDIPTKGAGDGPRPDTATDSSSEDGDVTCALLLANSFVGSLLQASGGMMQWCMLYTPGLIRGYTVVHRDHPGLFRGSPWLVRHVRDSSVAIPGWSGLTLDRLGTP